MLCLLLAIASYPSYLGCSRAISPGSVIMGSPAVASGEVAASFGGRPCGGSFTPGEDLPILVSGGGIFMLEVSGGSILQGSSCDGVRKQATRLVGSSQDEVPLSTLSTAESSQSVSVWIGRASSSAGPVVISSACSLSAVAPALAPPPPPTPPAQPAGADGTEVELALPVALGSAAAALTAACCAAAWYRQRHLRRASATKQPLGVAVASSSSSAAEITSVAGSS